MSVIRKATPLYRVAVAGPSRLAMSASVARPLTPSTPASYRRPFSPAQQPNLLRTLTSTPPAKRFTRNVWAANPIVEYDEIKPLTQQPTDDILIVDVREPDEVALGTLPSAVNLPLSRLPEALDEDFEPGRFKKEFAFKKPAAGQKIIFFCRSGKRSATAAEIAGMHGYANVRNYVGSWLEWSEKEGIPNLLAA
ncbi:endoplasmic reticulum protein [Trichosporon asahii var. asahii CBS 2479]|uniref:Endoplasmic reticulum protein n=1 Tax=Trichosporon asahii var. asahii (strain ATCC 90039 / CBS 2479 / JCM 2466 / KCTC 7840 / NBRC 103889/ NCYC 2677 / UAMH 7654) TaxID=1186058 RepID=J5SKH9_TRIAS|nr:endoplasmic reticulum protein [Trichosporon asahii var. asahii CBS 2479]EJT46106.1 endoplasmic reticulum protein [Trichosporon asahii var. asahii CBS 2479]